MRRIADRFGISLSRMEAEPISHSRDYTHRLAFVEKIENDPERKYLRYSPSLWIVWRIRELAPHYSYERIVQILKNEREKLPNPSRYKIPSEPTVKDIILKNGLRTEEDLHRIRSKALTRRRPNSLSNESRAELVDIAAAFFSGQKFKNISRQVNMADLRAGLLNLIQREVIYFMPHPNEKWEATKHGWVKYLQSRQKFFVVDVLRKIGPVTQRGNLRWPLSNTREEVLERIPSSAGPLFVSNLRFARPLSPRERQVFDMLVSGVTRKEIANRIGVTPSRISQLITVLRSIVKT